VIRSSPCPQNKSLAFQLFCALDTDNSGGLDQGDFVNVQGMFATAAAATRTNKMLATIFEELKLFTADLNGDGTIDFDEFLVAFMKRAVKERYEMACPPAGASLRQYVTGLEAELNGRLASMINHVASRVPERMTEVMRTVTEPLQDEDQVFGWIRVSPTSYEALFSLFCQLDSDGSGGLDSRDIIQYWHGQHGIEPVQEGSAIGRRNKVLIELLREFERLAADTNGDGTVDFEEFMHAISSRALESEFQLPPCAYSFGEFFEGLEQELNVRIRSIVDTCVQSI